LKKKPTPRHVDLIPRDGVTGMSPMTQQHFIGVKRKMMEFVQHQVMLEGDGFPPGPPLFPPPPPPYPPVPLPQASSSSSVQGTVP